MVCCQSGRQCCTGSRGIVLGLAFLSINDLADGPESVHRPQVLTSKAGEGCKSPGIQSDPDELEKRSEKTGRNTKPKSEAGSSRGGRRRMGIAAPLAG